MSGTRPLSSGSVSGTTAAPTPETITAPLTLVPSGTTETSVARGGTVTTVPRPGRRSARVLRQLLPGGRARHDGGGADSPGPGEQTFLAPVGTITEAPERIGGPATAWDRSPSANVRRVAVSGCSEVTYTPITPLSMADWRAAARASLATPSGGTRTSPMPSGAKTDVLADEAHRGPHLVCRRVGQREQAPARAGAEPEQDVVGGRGLLAGSQSWLVWPRPSSSELSSTVAASRPRRGDHVERELAAARRDLARGRAGRCCGRGRTPRAGAGTSMRPCPPRR